MWAEFKGGGLSVDDLKSCPFCGSLVSRINSLDIWFFECTNKDCTAVVSFAGKDCSNEKNAIGHWNRRAEDG